MIDYIYKVLIGFDGMVSTHYFNEMEEIVEYLNDYAQELHESMGGDIVFATEKTLTAKINGHYLCAVIKEHN